MLSYQYRKSHCGDKTAVRSSYLHNGISYTGILVCVSKLTIISSDNGLSPGRSQAIIWTSAGILIMRPLGTNFSEILIGNQTFSFKKIHSQMSSAKWHPFCLCLGVLTVMWPQWQDAFYLCKRTTSIFMLQCYSYYHHVLTLLVFVILISTVCIWLMQRVSSFKCQ